MPTWTLASAQSTSSPFIQILSVSCIGSALLGFRRMVVRDDVGGLCAGQASELERRKADDMVGRAGARPDDGMPEERALQEDGVDRGQRERGDGPGSEAGRTLDLCRLR